MVQKTFGYRILLFIIVAMLTIAVAIIPDIISKDVEAWCKQIFGPNYKFYLLGIMVGGSALVVFFTTDFARGFILGVKKYQQNKFGVPPTEANRSLLKEARTAISQKADNEKALRLLSTIRLSSLDVEIALLSARLVEESRNRHQGISSQDETSRASTRIIRDTLYLIDALEKEISNEQEQDETIRAYLQKRYSFRLSQKLSGRQPVNLKYIPSIEGTSEETNLYFVFKGDEEIQQGIAQIFRQSQGRLLIVGDPGAGKTTLLLQLVLELLKSEPEAIPVMLNLATWKKEFITLETWLAEILPTELGVIKRVALELLQQNRLILFLDGFDEIKEEDRNACIEALGQYSALPACRFVISSRKNEYRQVAKDAPVYAQIEVRPLTVIQMIEELEKVGYDQPEAKPLILALKTDSLLGKVAQTPFYFNLLQLLFAEGKRLSDLNFISTNIAARQNELLKYFINYCLRPQKNDDYNVENTKRWLAFFASRLERKKIEIFELGTLQYDWWHWSRIQLIFIWTITLLIANLNIYLPLLISIWITFIISAGAKMGLTIGMYIILAIFIFIGSIVIWRHDAPSISTTERINFHWSAIIPFTKTSYADVFSPSLFIGIIMGLIGMFILEFPQGLIAGMLMFILVFIFFLIAMFFELSHSNIIQINFPYQRFNMSSKWLHFSILQHLLLKFQLYISGYLPFNLVQFLESMGERHILESNGVSWRFHHKLIQNYFTLIWQEHWEVEEWQKFIALKPKNANAHFNLGSVYFNQKKWDEAIKQFEVALNLAPKDALTSYFLGNAFEAQSKFEQAIEYYQKTTILMPNLSSAYLKLGNSFRALNRLEEASEQYQIGINVNPSFSEAYNNLGVVLRSQGKQAEAIQQYQLAIKLNPDFAEAYNNLGVVFKSQNNLDEAIKYHLKAVDLNPNYIEAYDNLGYTFFFNKELEKAIQYWQKTIELEPQKIASYINISRSYSMLRKFEDAKKIIYDAMGVLGENDSECIIMLISIELIQKNITAAKNHFIKYIQLAENDEAFLKRIESIHTSLGLADLGISFELFKEIFQQVDSLKKLPLNEPPE